MRLISPIVSANHYPPLVEAHGLICFAKRLSITLAPQNAISALPRKQTCAVQ